MKKNSSAVLSVAECCTMMREHGIPCSNMRVTDDIENGLLPFGRVSSVGMTGRRTVQIFRVDFLRWLEEKTGVAV